MMTALSALFPQQQQQQLLDEQQELHHQHVTDNILLEN